MLHESPRLQKPTCCFLRIKDFQQVLSIRCARGTLLHLLHQRLCFKVLDNQIRHDLCFFQSGTDHFEAFDEMKRGEFISVLEAVQAAGWRKTPTAVDNMRKSWEKATDQERQTIATEVVGWLLQRNVEERNRVYKEAEKRMAERPKDKEINT